MSKRAQNVSKAPWGAVTQRYWILLVTCLGCTGPVTIGLGPQPQGNAGASGAKQEQEGGLARAGAAGAPSCRATVELQQVPLDLVITLDKSLTMNELTSVTGETKWLAVSDAIKEFSNDPRSAGLGVAVGFFAVLDQQNQVSCRASDYEALPVPMGTLNEHAPTIAAAVDSVDFSTSASAAKTPMHIALQGAVAYARSWATQHLDHEVTVVLATDGAPNACSGTFEDVIAAAAQGVNGAPTISTHVISILDPNAIDTRTTTLENQLDSLNRVAAAGRTGSALVVDTTITALTRDQFASALDAIGQSRENLCRFAMPAAAGDQFDAAQVTVHLGTTPIPWRSIEADCGSADGYFCDDNLNPRSISLCNSTCTTFLSNRNLLPQFSVGCDSVPNDLGASSKTIDGGVL